MVTLRRKNIFLCIGLCIVAFIAVVSWRWGVGQAAQGSPTMHGRGPLNALVTVTFYGDPSSRLSMEAYVEMKRLAETFPLDLRIEYRHNVPGFRFGGIRRSQELECASRFGAFWRYLDLSMRSLDSAWPSSGAVAQKLLLPVDTYTACITDPDVAASIARDTQDARARGIADLPAVLLNGKRFTGPLSSSALQRAVTDAIALQQTSTYVPRIGAVDLWERQAEGLVPVIVDVRSKQRYHDGQINDAIPAPELAGSPDSDTVLRVMKPWLTAPLVVIITEPEKPRYELFTRLRSLGVSFVRFDDMEAARKIQGFTL